MNWDIVATYYIYFINAIFIIILVFFERRNPQITLAWLLTLTFLPLVGFPLYLFFGKGFWHDRKRLAVKKQADVGFKRLCKIKRQASIRNIPEKYRDIAAMLLKSGQCAYTDDNKVTLITCGQEKYRMLMDDIRNAKNSINLLYFIIKNDTVGKELISLLEDKAREGVQVRVLYDDFGSFTTPGRIFKGIRKAGGKVLRFFPLSVGSYFKLNYRNHRKIAVIDGEIGYIGGMNIGDEYAGAAGVWRDTHLRLTGSAVIALQERFFMDWLYAGDKQTPDARLFRKLVSSDGTHVEIGDQSVGMQIVSSGPDIKGEQIKYGLMKMMNAARKTLYIQTPYFVPDSSFLDAVKMTAMSGVDVRLILPGNPDKAYVWYCSLSYLPEVLNAGVRVYLYNGFIHSKMMICDGQMVSIGSTNLDMRSLLVHFEANAFIYDHGFATKCTRAYLEDIRNSVEIDMIWYRKRNVLKKMMEGIFRLFAPLM